MSALDKVKKHTVPKNDSALVLELAKRGTLDWSPKENWVDKEGGLPRYIEEVALALLQERGFTRERAIATAINRIKRWAAGLDNVKADTRIKAVAALAQWEKMKASAAIKRAAKKAKK